MGCGGNPTPWERPGPRSTVTKEKWGLLRVPSTLSLGSSLGQKFGGWVLGLGPQPQLGQLSDLCRKCWALFFILNFLLRDTKHTVKYTDLFLG